MIGAIIGDIAGSHVEFNYHKMKDYELFADDCRITADSIMTLAVAKAIMGAEKTKTSTIDGCERAPVERLSVKYMREIGRHYSNRGYGGMFLRWIFSEDPKPYGSFGSGAAARISPAGFLAKTEGEAKRLSEAVTGVTHNHAEGLKGAEAVSVAIYMARCGFMKSEIRHKINNSYYSLNFTIDEIRDTCTFNETCQETVPRAIEVFLESVSFEDAVRTAVSLGGNSHTLAAITGSIAEAYFGVPEDAEDKALAFLDEELRAIYDEWCEFIGSENPLHKFQVLTKYIDRVSNAESFGEWFFDRGNDGAAEHSFQMPFIEYSELVNLFVDEFYHFSENRPEYQLTNYATVLEKNGLKWEFGTMGRADVAALDAQCILALIMGVIRVERFCTGALLGSFEDGSILKWLKKLKIMDEHQMTAPIEEIYIEIGSVDGCDTYRLIFENGTAKLVAAPRHKSPEEKQYSLEQTRKLLNNFKNLHVEHWRSEYTNPCIIDGTSWKLVVKSEGHSNVWTGSNAFPYNWDDLLSYFGIEYISNDERVMIKRLTIELDGHQRFDVKGIDQEAYWDYTEGLTIDHDKEQLIIKQNIGSGCIVSHQYDVQGGMDGLLLTAEECFNNGQWTDASTSDDIDGVRFFNLEAEFYNGSKILHSGIYNRKSIPEQPWSELLDAIREFISFYGFGEILNKRMFMNARKDGEVIYLQVSVGDIDKTFYYRTDDESIEIGDYVIVPFGTSNAEQIACVDNIEYFQIDEVPFPLEKTKQVIEKVPSIDQ